MRATRSIAWREIAMTTKEEREHETTVKGMIRVSGRDVWVVDRSLFPTRGPVGQKLKFLLRYGILAPSYFNLQPWKFLVKNDTIFFYADLDRALPITDPHNRALYLSCGCVLNYLNLAARHYGYEGASTSASYDAAARARQCEALPAGPNWRAHCNL